MYHAAVVQVQAVYPVRYHAQNAVGASPHSSHQGCSSLAHSGVEAVYPRFCKHPWCATESGQPHQHPERVIILHAQSAIPFIWIICPQAACIEGSTVCFKETKFYFFWAVSKPAGYHICSNGQRSALALNICVIFKVWVHQMPQIFKLFNYTQWLII